MRNHLACGEFYQCINDEAISRLCPEGLWFNHNQQRCTETHMVYCELDEIICSEVEEIQRIRSPSSCSDYILCTYGFPFPFRCPDNLFFDESTETCESPELVNCELNVSPEPPRNVCDGRLDFTLAGSVESCVIYFVCYNNEILFELECPIGQFFDPVTEVCGGAADGFECLL